MDGLRYILHTHVQTCDVTGRVESATEWTAFGTFFTHVQTCDVQKKNPLLCDMNVSSAATQKYYLIHENRFESSKNAMLSRCVSKNSEKVFRNESLKHMI